MTRHGHLNFLLVLLAFVNVSHGIYQGSTDENSDQSLVHVRIRREASKGGGFGVTGYHAIQVADDSGEEGEPNRQEPWRPPSGGGRRTSRRREEGAEEYGGYPSGPRRRISEEGAGRRRPSARREDESEKDRGRRGGRHRDHGGPDEEEEGATSRGRHRSEGGSERGRGHGRGRGRGRGRGHGSGGGRRHREEEEDTGRQADRSRGGRRPSGSEAPDKAGPIGEGITVTGFHELHVAEDSGEDRGNGPTGGGRGRGGDEGSRMRRPSYGPGRQRPSRPEEEDDRGWGGRERPRQSRRRGGFGGSQKTSQGSGDGSNFGVTGYHDIVVADDD
ncbi:hypothetical protein V5799_034212 [Amblyomma americanum]|uniref:Uncharacterized protein n=1 Tax=Amblyomma americanum TaxID=6943 RepID=A0AAQ4DL31_AMBAM